MEMLVEKEEKKEKKKQQSFETISRQTKKKGTKMRDQLAHFRPFFVSLFFFFRLC
jgi:hypothetical protein